MKTATGLTVIAVGAILALAVNAGTPGINLHVAGLIIVLVGLAGLLLRGRASGWIRRRIVLHGNFHQPKGTEFAGEEDEIEHPGYVMQDDPAVLASEVLSSAELADAAARHGRRPHSASPASPASPGEHGSNRDLAAAPPDGPEGPARSGAG
jgi:hypothetical protein